MDCPECSHLKVFFLLDSDQARKAFFYNGYNIEKNQTELTVTYKWKNFVNGDNPPSGGALSEEYNCLQDGNMGYYVDNQECRPSVDPYENIMCPSGYEPFRGILAGPTGQSSAVANAGSSNNAAFSSRYQIDDVAWLGAQEWALLNDGNDVIQYGTIIGHGRGSEIDSKHLAVTTRGPRLSFRVAMVVTLLDLEPCLICIDKGIFECFKEVLDVGFEYVCPDSDPECENPVPVPKIKEDEYGRGYINYGILVSPNLITNQKYTRFLNTIAVNDYYGGNDLQLWHRDMHPNIKRTEHQDSIHKYSYVCDPLASSLPVTNVNLMGAVYYIKWMNAFFCNPFKYSEAQLLEDSSLKNCEDCVDSIDEASYRYNGDN